MLSAYGYQIRHKKGTDNCNADSLSRLPLPEKPTHVPDPGEALLDMPDKSPITAAQIHLWTDRDSTLAKVRNMISQGWQQADKEEIKKFL